MLQSKCICQCCFRAGISNVAEVVHHPTPNLSGWLCLPEQLPVARRCSHSFDRGSFSQLCARQMTPPQTSPRLDAFERSSTCRSAFYHAWKTVDECASGL